MLLACFDLQQAAARGLLAGILLADFTQLLFLGFFIPANWNESCSQPIREWNTLYASRLAVEVILLCWVLCTASSSERQRRSRSRLATILVWSNGALCLLGVVWLLTGPDCRREAPWQTGAAIAMLCFHALALVPVLCLVLQQFLVWAAPPTAPAAPVDRLKRRRSISFDECASGAAAVPGGGKLVMQCMVCLCDYDSSDCLMVLCCLHHGHSACLAQWLATKASCPLCRRRVGGSPRSIRPDEIRLLLQRSIAATGADADAGSGPGPGSVPVSTSSSHEGKELMAAATDGAPSPSTSSSETPRITIEILEEQAGSSGAGPAVVSAAREAAVLDMA